MKDVRATKEMIHGWRKLYYGDLLISKKMKIYPQKY